MSRGGKRVGAGRPRVLSALHRLCIGADCEGEVGRLGEQALEAARNEILGEYEAVIAPIHRIPPGAARQNWLQSEAFRDHQDDVECERQAIAETLTGLLPEAGESPRLIEITAKKPRGFRKQIIAKVAADWSERLGKKVNESTVRHCWDEVRALRRRLMSEAEPTAVV